MHARLSIRPKALYHDRIDVDNSNRVFYVYSLGRYNNMCTYHYGESTDICLTELLLRNKLPFYERRVCIPIEDKVRSKAVFDKYIEDKGIACKIPVTGLENWDAFYSEDFETIQKDIDNMYGDKLCN